MTRLSRESGAGQLRLFTCEPKLASCQLLANIMSKTMLVLCNCFLLFTSGTAITTTDPVLGRQSKEPVIAGAVDFTYQIFMDPGCEKFAADNDTKQRCEGHLRTVCLHNNGGKLHRDLFKQHRKENPSR